ncbi:MAG: hypothetical protein JKY08_12325 [Flavobacteriaceae bacterium]|nr:hypothetical protein [Flavobacteriaceae bacterium]
MTKSFYFLLFIACFSITNLTAQTHTVSLSTPLLSSIVVGENSSIEVSSTYNSEKLIIQFNSTQNSQGVSLVPEVLIATSTTEDWNTNTHWFHASYGNCYGNGSYYTWEDCNSNPAGWSVNKDKTGAVTFSISWRKLNIIPKPGLKLHLSLKLSNPVNNTYYWPENATISSPNSWAIVVLK